MSPFRSSKTILKANFLPFSDYSYNSFNYSYRPGFEFDSAYLHVTNN